LGAKRGNILKVKQWGIKISMNVNIRDKTELKKVCQARNNSVKDEKGDLVRLQCTSDR
jgi:hypothetical protein